MVLTDALPLIPVPASLRREHGDLAIGSLRIVGDPTAGARLRDGLSLRTSTSLAEASEPGPGVVEVSLTLGSGPAEGYELDTRGEGIRIVGHDPAGLFYGTRTLLQLLTTTDPGTDAGDERTGDREGRWRVPRLLITDAPRFAHRGVMLDVARHFFSVQEVLAFIDRAVALKLNRLHLHLSDDQGWRIQIDSWPLLTERASIGDAGGCDGGFFTKDDYRRIVEYATARHMIVIPEIDLPGHTHAVGVAYPELVEEPRLGPTATQEAAALGQALPVHGRHFAGWAVGHSSVRIGEERTEHFVRDVLEEVAAMTPGPYLHIGGDECLGTPPTEFAAFISHVSRLVAGLSKTPIAWHEAGAVDDVAEGTIGQYWGSVDPQGSHAAEAAHFVERGGGLIMSPSDRTYLDMKPAAGFPLGLEWAGIVPLRLAYDWDPAAVLPAVPEDAILGVEAALWTETVHDFEHLDALVFPRLTAHAETAWSPRGGAERTWGSFRARLRALTPVLRAFGIRMPPEEPDAGQ